MLSEIGANNYNLTLRKPLLQSADSPPCPKAYTDSFPNEVFSHAIAMSQVQLDVCLLWVTPRIEKRINCQPHFDATRLCAALQTVRCAVQYTHKTQHRAHSTQHTAHSTQHTAHSAQPKASTIQQHSLQYSEKAHSTHRSQHQTTRSTHHTARSKQQPAHSTLPQHALSTQPQHTEL